jgi:hypothetical protein
MRDGKWKIVHNRKTGDEPALFDLRQDIGESKNLANEQGEVFKAMLKKLNAWEKELEEPRWGPGASSTKLKKK